MTTIALAGQALMKQPVTPNDRAGEDLVHLLCSAGLAIANFEGTLADRDAVPTKAGTVHAADLTTLAGLRALGIGAVTLANNHMYDFGPAGIYTTRRAVTRAGMLAAGAGADAEEAAAPAFGRAGALTVALIGADCGPQPDIVYAGAKRAGINSLRMRRVLTVPEADAQRLAAIVAESRYPLWRKNRLAAGMPVPPTGLAIDFFGLAIEPGSSVGYSARPDSGDLERLAATIRKARERADVVAIVLHNHHWEPDWADTPGWLRGVARQLVAAGAGIVACHGAPLLGGMEIIDGAPVYYGLGNLIFHCRPARAARYDAAGLDVWSSVVATQRFSNEGRLQSIDIAPICAGAPAADSSDWTAPRLLDGESARAVIDGFLARSCLDGWTVAVRHGRALLVPTAIAA